MSLPLFTRLPGWMFGLPVVAALVLASSFASAEEITFEISQDSDEAFTKRLPETIADLKRMQERVETLSSSLRKATVGLQIGQAQGSGVIVSEDGIVLTAAHVSGKPGRRAKIIFPDGKTAWGKTLGRNAGVDAGMVQLDDQKKSWPYVKLGDFKEIGVGDWAIALGHPRGYIRGRPPVVRLGRLIFKRNSVLQTDCTLVGGDSGGPLFNLRGELIGIHSRIGATSAWNFHVPVSAYSDDWDRMVAGESWGGIFGRSSDGDELNTAVMGVMGDDHPQGCKVTAVTPAFPASKAGLREGDIITKFDGEKVSGFEGLYKLVGKKKPGDEVTVSYLRGDETREVKLTLVKRG